jgi:hypothetical protein
MAEEVKTDTESPLKLEDFKLTEVLFNNAAKKMICLLGKFPISVDDQGIVIVEKVEFPEEFFTTESEEESILKHTALEKIFANDIYLNCFGFPDQKFNSEF